MLERLTTEKRNPASAGIDALGPLEIVRLMNAEDATVAAAVALQERSIAQAMECVAGCLGRGGRLIYVGAGTSGRLGVLDAAECPPTFNSEPWQVQGVIAGGPSALVQAVEGAEDDPQRGRDDLLPMKLGADDVAFGIATSGRTPYVLGAMRHARHCGSATVGFSCTDLPGLAAEVDIMITPVVGPEVISGSTRLKAGTATKMVLNIVTTGAMVLLGKTYGNLMVDLRATNSKLVDRSKRIVSDLTGLSPEAAETLLGQCQGDVKTAVVMHLRDLDANAARQQLQRFDGRLRPALEEAP